MGEEGPPPPNVTYRERHRDRHQRQRHPQRLGRQPNDGQRKWRGGQAEGGAEEGGPGRGSGDRQGGKAWARGR